MADPKIRVLRLLEYEYDSPQAMERDMMEWTTNVSNGRMKMRSTKLDPKWIETDDPGTLDG